MGNNIKIIFVISTILAIISLFIVFHSFSKTIEELEEKPIRFHMQHIFIAPSLLMMFGVAIYNWKRNVDQPITFNEMVKSELNRFFAKINA